MRCGTHRSGQLTVLLFEGAAVLWKVPCMSMLVWDASGLREPALHANATTGDTVSRWMCKKCVAAYQVTLGLALGSAIGEQAGGALGVCPGHLPMVTTSARVRAQVRSAGHAVRPRAPQLRP
jgi:hypothetical protein